VATDAATAPAASHRLVQRLAVITTTALDRRPEYYIGSTDPAIQRGQRVSSAEHGRWMQRPVFHSGVTGMHFAREYSPECPKDAESARL